MDYLKAEEIKNNDEVRTRNRNFSGPAVRHGFSIKIVERYAKLFPNTVEKLKILDCGSASGKFFGDLESAGFRNIYGVDIDDYLQPEYKKLLKEFKTADLSYEKLPWADGNFDILTAWCLVPHLENPHNFIREAFRVLKTGGLFIFSSINVASPSHRKYFYKTGDFPGYHERNNHISIITSAIFKKTILRYFSLVAIEHFIAPRIFDGLRGNIRSFIYRLVGGWPSLRQKLDERWGVKICYILQKK